MPKVLNVIAPVIIGAFTIAFGVANRDYLGSYTDHPYAITGFSLVVIGCMMWLAYGLAVLDE